MLSNIQMLSFIPQIKSWNPGTWLTSCLTLFQAGPQWSLWSYHRHCSVLGTRRRKRRTNNTRPSSWPPGTAARWFQWSSGPSGVTRCTWALSTPWATLLRRRSCTTTTSSSSTITTTTRITINSTWAIRMTTTLRTRTASANVSLLSTSTRAWSRTPEPPN